MKRILVAYASRSSSTVEVAQAIAGGLLQNGASVEVEPVDAYLHLPRYDAFIVGGLLYRMGWDSRIVDFLWKNQTALRAKPVAYFATGLGIVPTKDLSAEDQAVFVDPGMLMPPKDPARLSPLEKYMTFQHYMQPAILRAPSIRPISIAFFAGKLDFKKLNFPDKLIMHLLIWMTGRTAGDHRNWETIQNWVKTITPTMLADERIVYSMPVPAVMGLK
jgi:menaquinone-dependent protoporphyrinogen oxidase